MNYNHLPETTHQYQFEVKKFRFLQNIALIQDDYTNNYFGISQA